MSINVNYAISLANRLRNDMSRLTAIKNSLSYVRGSWNNGWRAREMVYLNIVIDNLNREINALSNEMQRISGDIITTAYELKREDDERRASPVRPM